MTGGIEQLDGRAAAPSAGAQLHGGGGEACVDRQRGTACAAPCADAERALQAVAGCARHLSGPRLVFMDALGSLAHGGFSPHVSDVDVALILSDPLEADDPGKIDGVSARVRESGTALAGRISVFWGSPATLAGCAVGGRFAAAD